MSKEEKCPKGKIMSKEEKCPYDGELLQGQGNDESAIILNNDVSLKPLREISSSYFGLNPPILYDGYWIITPKPIPDGYDLRSLALELRDEGINIKIPPEIPSNTPTFLEVFGV